MKKFHHSGCLLSLCHRDKQSALPPDQIVSPVFGITRSFLNCTGYNQKLNAIKRVVVKSMRVMKSTGNSIIGKIAPGLVVYRHAAAAGQ